MTWLDVDPAHPFGLANLPYGSFTTDGTPRVGVAIGEHVLDLGATAAALLPTHAELFTGGSLDGLLAAGPAGWAQVRTAVTAWLTDDAHRGGVALVPAADAQMLLPFAVADYVDFYASRAPRHATSAGSSGPTREPLPPNWRHLPIGYHGRAGTVVVSGTPVVAPVGPAQGAGRRRPRRSARRRGSTSRPSSASSSARRPRSASRSRSTASPTTSSASCLLNDWSRPRHPGLGVRPARPVPRQVVRHLGLAVGDAAGRARRTPGVARPAQDPEPLPYLRDAGRRGASTSRSRSRSTATSCRRPPYATMYWTPAQMLAHLTVNGASPAHRRPVRLRHDQRPGAGTSAARCSS